MQFSLAVYGPPGTTQASDSAYRFARAALDAGHGLYRVFFYREGVHNASALLTPPQDETDHLARWRALAGEHPVELSVCIAAALRRGVLDEKEAARYERSAHNLAPEFTIAGLGQLLDAAVYSDRLITFGG